MTRKIHTVVAAALILGAFATSSPLYAHAKAGAPAQQNMMGGGNMGSMDMMGMMEQMTKMMTLCNQMMEMSMKNMGGANMQMPMDGQATPEKKN